MNTDQALQILKQVTDGAVQRGFFATTEDVINVSNALMTVSADVEKHKQLVQATMQQQINQAQ